MVGSPEPKKPAPTHCLGLLKPNHQEKNSKNANKLLKFGFKVFLLSIALPQGLLKVVPIYFKIFTVKVVGQTISVCSTTKMSKM